MIQNIFIVHTPFHVFISENIIKNYFSKKNYKNVIFFEFAKDFQSINKKLWSKIFFLKYVGNSSVGHKRYLISELNMEIIKQYVDKNIDTNIFLSDIAWPMNNRVFFDNKLRNMVKYSLFSDGLGTYALPKVTLALFVRGLVKNVNGLLHLGTKYKNYIGNQFGLDRKEIKYIYAPNVKIIDCESSKKKEVSFNQVNKNINFNKQKCLFLDQPFWLHMQEQQWKSTREISLKFLKSLDIKEIYYKNHHFGREEEEFYYKSKGFRIINSNNCAEQIVAENDFGVVVSYIGSALFNLKCIFNNELRCISLFSKKISTANGYNDNTTDKITDLFRKVNVEMIILP